MYSISFFAAKWTCLQQEIFTYPQWLIDFFLCQLCPTEQPSGHCQCELCSPFWKKEHKAINQKNTLLTLKRTKQWNKVETNFGKKNNEITAAKKYKLLLTKVAAA